MADNEGQESEWGTENEDFDSEEEKDFFRAWDTEAGWVPDVHKLSLKELIKRGYPSSVNAKNEGRFPVGVFPKGLRLCLDEISDMQKNASLSKIERVAYCHGLAIVIRNPKTREISTFHKLLRRAAWDAEDFELIDRLEVKSDNYKFARDAPNSASSIGILHDRDGLISRLARRFGMTNPKLYCCMIVVSIMTWPNARWQKKLIEEHNRFWTHVDNKLEELRTELNKIPPVV